MLSIFFNQNYFYDKNRKKCEQKPKEEREELVEKNAVNGIIQWSIPFLYLVPMNKSETFIVQHLESKWVKVLMEIEGVAFA